MQSKLRAALSFLGREALQIVLPSWCVVCEAALPWSERMASCCRACWEALPKIRGPKCRSCARPSPLHVTGDPLCFDCHLDPLPVEWCDAWGEYRTSLEKLLHALKFERHDFLDSALASLLEETLRERGDLSFDAIAAVPMQKTRERRRGYNQAHLLARALGEKLGIPFERRLLLRNPGPRPAQSTLPKRDRAANVKGAFVASEAGDLSVLVVDDICTTGETLRACASALLAGGAARVCAVTVAKAT